ncbi:MAG: hypothetical protein J3K34DRAFT_447531 [Monoraphidium minutum]|nr:MAG: hypothetical protein J3K34DRAFT_447531 [Monoraphidium minutum]
MQGCARPQARVCAPARQQLRSQTGNGAGGCGGRPAAVPPAPVASRQQDRQGAAAPSLHAPNATKRGVASTSCKCWSGRLSSHPRSPRNKQKRLSQKHTPAKGMGSVGSGRAVAAAACLCRQPRPLPPRRPAVTRSGVGGEGAQGYPLRRPRPQTAASNQSKPNQNASSLGPCATSGGKVPPCRGRRQVHTTKRGPPAPWHRPFGNTTHASAMEAMPAAEALRGLSATPQTGGFCAPRGIVGNGVGGCVEGGTRTPL